MERNEQNYMNNRVQVNLQFTADVEQAKRQVQDLQEKLTSLINHPLPIGAEMTTQIQQATKAAAELKVHLQNATNVKTGMLDFGKLNQSIKQSGKSLSEYGAQLQQLGAGGQQAFMQLADSVAAAEVPIRRSNQLLSDMFTTLKNTAKWQVSSSVLHGFMGAVSKAYGYAQDLNESLNNIRIVTGQNTEQMAKFATEANKAAKALSTSTVDYTNASLIYYQQGLNDQQVKERADITIKLANVSRQSAEIVSDQMTAVWNNFYDGSRSLEYYADAMTALGAATASSTEEISEGLEKFAAVADTVGLSYEYATAALATVTAQTRQSADVVGTAFKTLFARIQDLNLGKTLDDGTTLGTYAQALDTVGIQIKDGNNGLKDMDQVLSEMGAKWKTLSEDQQVALAKAVAGIRQYTQLIALMDNWDFMQRNLDTVNNSTGALQEQADIYAESWEAASKRVKASAEEVYSALLNDEFFIDLNNGLADFLDTLGSVTKGLGGLKGILSILGVVATRVFSTQIAQGLRDAAYSVKMMTKSGRDAVSQEKKDEMTAIQNQLKKYENVGLYDKQMTKAYEEQIAAQIEIIDNAEHMSEIEKTIAQTLLDQGKALSNQAMTQAKMAQQARQEGASIGGDILAINDREDKDVNEAAKGLLNIKKQAINVGNIEAMARSITPTQKLSSEQFKELDKIIAGLGEDFKDSGKKIKASMNELQESKDSPEELAKILHDLQKELDSLQNEVRDSEAIDIADALGIDKNDEQKMKALREELDKYAAAYQKVGMAEYRAGMEGKNAKQAFEEAGQAAKNAKGNLKDWADGITATASVLTAASSVLASFKGLMDTLNDPDISGWEKFITILSSVGMTTMSLMSIFSSARQAWEAFNLVQYKDIIATKISTIVTKLDSKAKKENGDQTDALAKKIKEKTAATKQDTINTVVNKQGTFKSGTRKDGNNWYQKNGKFISEKEYRQGVGNGLGQAGTFGAMALLIAGIVTIAASIHWASEILNKDTKEAEAAAELASRAQENYNKQQEAYSSFKSQADEYNNAVNGLDNLTKGTLEYEEAVTQANQKALELLKTNEDLGYVYNKETGLIEIDQRSLAVAQQNQLRKMQAAQAAAMMANMSANSANLRAQQSALAREKLESQGYVDDDDLAQGIGVAGGAIGAGAAAAGATALVAGTFGAVNAWNPAGWAALIVAGIAAIAGGIVAATQNDAEEAEYQALEDLAKLYATKTDDTKFEDLVDQLNLADHKLAQSLKDNEDATIKLIKELHEHALEVKRNTEAIIGDTAGESAGLLTGAYRQAQARRQAEYQSMIDDINRTEDYGSNDDITNFINTYDKVMGTNFASKLSAVENDVQMGDSGLEIVWRENGQEQKKLLTEMVHEMSALQAERDIADDAILYQDKLTAQGNNIVKYAASSETNFSNRLSRKDLESFNFANLEEYADYLTTTLGLSQAEIEANAERSIADMYQYAKESVRKADEGFKELYTQSEEEVRSYYNNNIKDIFDNASLDTQVQFRNFLDKAFRIGGQTGLDIFDNIFNQLQSTEIDEFINNIGSIDWATTTPEQLTEQFKQWGIQTDISEFKLQQLINTMREGVPGLEALTKQTKSLLDVLKDLRAGDTITPEEYKQLVESGLGFEKYFTLMYDGTYRLVDAAIDFEQAVKQDFVAQAQKDYEAAVNKYDTTQQQATNMEKLLQGDKLQTDLNLVVSDAFKYAVEENDKLIAESQSSERDSIYTLAKQSGATGHGNQGKVFFNGTKWQARQAYENDQSALALAELLNTSELRSGSLGDTNLTNHTAFMRGDSVVFFGSNSQNGQLGYNFGENGKNWTGNETQQFNTDQLTQNMKYMWDVVDSMDPTGTLLADNELGAEFSLTTFFADGQVLQERVNKLQELYNKAVASYQAIDNTLKETKEGMANAYGSSLSTASSQSELLNLYNKSKSGYDKLNQQEKQNILFNTSLSLRSAEEESRLDTEELENYTKYLMANNKALSTNCELARNIARRALRQQNAIEELSDSYSDWNQILQTTNALTPAHAEAYDQLTNAIAGYLGVSQEAVQALSTEILLSEEFKSLVERALGGDAAAYKEMGVTIAQSLLSGIEDADPELIINDLLTPDTINAEYLDFFNQMLRESTKTAGQLEDIFNAIQLEPIYVTVDGIEQIFGFKQSSLADSFYSLLDQSKQSTPDKKKQSEVLERYKEVNDQIDNVQNALDDAAKAMDRLYGKSRIAQMQEINKIVANEVELLKQKRQEAEAYLEVDQAELNQIAQQYIGTTFGFIEGTGDIANYTEVMRAVWDNYNAYYENAKVGGFSDDEQDRLDEYEDAINKVQAAVSQYDETRELVEDIDDEIQAKLYEMQDRQYEEFTYAIDMKLEIRDLKLEYNQYQVDQVMNDLIESSAVGRFDALMNERLELLKNSDNRNELNELISLYQQGEKALAAIQAGETVAPENMGISQADYVEGLKDQYSKTMENIQALQEYEAAMQSYYGDTLAAANEELDKYITQMTNANSVLSHYKNLLELTGKLTDYQTIGKILEGQSESAYNSLVVSKMINEAKQLEAQMAQRAYEEALNSQNPKQIELLKEVWLTAQQAANEAQEQMLADTEAWAEAQTAILENSLAEFGKTLEEAITGGGSYADLSVSLERAAASQEEYLTTTNKIYETNKLINKAQQEIDKTTNTVAKRRMQNYIRETEQLQKQTRLSNFELEIQQAKYELLLAEIALEEAQNAKSTVRLQRDAEGNFGYVYTADQNAIDNAAQKLQDAENDLYNIRLEGANNYAQKSIQLQIEFADTMKELNERYQNGEFASMEAYQNAVLEAKEYYYNRLKDYSNLYSVATTEDIRIIEDAWSSEFSTMVEQTDWWATNVTDYIGKVQDAFMSWETNLKLLYTENGALSQIEKSISNTMAMAQTFKDLLVGPEGTIQNVNNLTSEAFELAQKYSKLRDELVGDNGLIEAYKKQIEDIIKLIEEVQELDGSTINVNQTMKYTVDASAFNSAVSIFSNAVGRFNGEVLDNKDKEVTATITENYFEDQADWLQQHKNDTIKLNQNTMGVQTWKLDNDNETLIRTDTVLDQDDLNAATITGRVRADGASGITMYEIQIGDKKYYIPHFGFSLHNNPQPSQDPNRKNMTMQYFDMFDTGGYTGAWGPGGKLALVHEKELILNPEDTVNFLTALGILDNIIATLDNYSINAQLGGLLSSPAFQMHNQDTLEQSVYIEASFPGVQDRSEIEEAFNNLINKASQYANRK